MNAAETGMREWLSTPGGRVFAAEHGGPAGALAAMYETDREERQAAYELNQERQRAGLDLLPAGAAVAAVRPRGGPQVAGSTDDVRRLLSRFDPAWRVRAGVDDAEYAPTRWDGQAQEWINYVAMQRNQA